MGTDTSSRIAPGPRGAKLLKTLLALRLDPLAGFVQVVREYGDVVYFALRHRSFLLVAHPRDVARVLHENRCNYRKQTRSYAKIRDLLGDGIVTSDGKTWQRQRRLIQPSFHGRQVASFVPVVTDAAAETLERWREADRPDEPVHVATAMTHLTLRIVARALFGTEVRHASDSIGEAITTTLAFTGRRAEGIFDIGVLPSPGQRRFRSALATLDALVYRLIAERRRAATHRQDLLALLLDARDERTGDGLGDVELRDQVLTLLLAGHETTANALAWTCQLLARHPDVQDRLRAEVGRVLGYRTPTGAEIAGLSCVRMVVQEALRLFPPLWLIERHAVGDDALGGYRTPAGSTLALSPYVTHRHPAFWDEPDRFDPDRFLPERVAARPHYAFFPFSGGPRACMGAGFAMMEAQLILALLVQRYRLAPVSDRPIVPRAGITLRPRKPIQIRIESVT